MNQPRVGPSPRRLLAGVCLLWWTAVAVPHAAAQEAAAPVADGSGPPVQCLFIGESLVPRLALGVRRVDGEDLDVLELRRQPDAGAAIIREADLFRPFFVADSRTDSAGGQWHLLQDGYSAAAPMGWAPERHLHLLESRYAYTFATEKRAERADLHDDSKQASQEAYERLLAQINGDSEGGRNTVAVLERPGAEAWRPVKIDDTVPFVELRIPPEARDREHPDTTPTFRFGIPVENRLVHMGAVCGGPIDEARLAELRGTVIEGLAMLFVIDETTSMNPYNKVVSKFIEDAGTSVIERPVPMRIDVWSYTDGPEGKRVNQPPGFPAVAAKVKGIEDVRALAAEVAKLGNHRPPGTYSNPPERMLEGLRDAIRDAEVPAGATLFVVVVGDTGHEPDDAGKEALIAEVAKLIVDKNARVYFMHVGDRQTEFERLFEVDFKAVKKAAMARDVPEEHLVYTEAEEGNLQEELEQARDAVEEQRRKLERQIRRMESRTPYTEPGPKLLTALEARGIDRGKFEDRHLQYFVPARGWLFHPTSKDTATARPQLRELFLLSAPEQEAVRKLFDTLRDKLSRGEQIDGDAVIAGFAHDLAAAAGNQALEGRVRAAWERIPQRQRSVGVFMEDVFGLRLKAALPFPPIAFAKDQPATGQEIERMLERIGRLGEAFRDAGDGAFWFEASSLVP